MTNPFRDPPEPANPYAAPKGQNVAAQGANPLFIPGLLFLLGSLFWSLYMVTGVAFMLSPNGPLHGEQFAYIRIGSAVSYALMFVLALIAAAGAVAMMMLKWKWLAWTGCIVGMLPMFGPCFGLTIPIAIWVLVLLRRPEVIARFT
jgi:hypothetical protein